MVGSFAAALALMNAVAPTGNHRLWVSPGDFVRPAHAKPCISPDQTSTFHCPMRGQTVHWEATHTFNPAAAVKDGKVWLIYRAEDDSGSGIGGYTSRLGLACSSDGIHFKKRPEPVLFPDNDDQKDREWEGGCEDPRCVETEGGSFLLFYTQYRRLGGNWGTDLGMAISKDLIHWTKLGPVKGVGRNGEVVVPSKSASLVTAVRHGRLVAAKIAGKYWLYYGEGTIKLLSSPDLKTWNAVPDFRVEPRAGRFDSGLAECGPPAVVMPKGIVLLYNGMNADGRDRDPSLAPGVYTGGQLVFDPADPTKLLARSDEPFFKPELPWEKTGQYKDGTTFLEGLVLFRRKWFLYYGCADQFVGVAISDILPFLSWPALDGKPQRAERTGILSLAHSIMMALPNFTAAIGLTDRPANLTDCQTQVASCGPD